MSSTANRGEGGGESTGAYWCHGCRERVPAGDVAGDDVPNCRSCGATMPFERSPGATGYAC
ncbi:hypothetical protein [Haloplanus halobius]|uniref:hypothetical protein n=1 Tax=Haloplanus halobius TaxID=2934938 RepID=UPI00201036B6|nr:hypothetical protein [Haloplanus sp. XH21]